MSRYVPRSLRICQMLFLALVVFTLPACSKSDIMYEESYMSGEKLGVSEERYFETVPLAAFDDAALEAVYMDYARYGGDDALNVSVSYNPQSQTFRALDAGEKAAEISEKLRYMGLKDVKVGVLPLHEGEAHVILSYTTLEAHAPENCGTMPGYDASVVEKDEDYKLGCTLETVLSKQVARPKDLRGNDHDTVVHDGRRLSNSVERYRDGAPNEALEGDNASTRE